ncbi:hypothetical protein K503DRAFT_571085 [Rhizopogon vinicolor AM-OR11-026]|uniref:Nephrocystin 3-like N-terminal domain-containing protein n=1 Tax=Rhizopogon vinicolor AM-OR11-026 TaxID=1314800 RepID=A0A1B7MJT8_9AGAM|nr:hypothetical protein K503DRAFT_571085 [Rhizopogon vinicolor AM-OR11-026]
MLLHETLFRGVTPRPKSGGWVLNISGSAPVTRRNHYPKITVSNSSLILSKSRVEDEYLPLYPDHVPGSPPPIYSDVDLFNLPLSAAFASSTNEDSDVMLFSKIACRFCSSVRPSAFLQHRTLYTLIDNIVPDSTSQDNTWAFFCRFVPLSGLFDSPVRGPLPMTLLGSGRARLIESLELELENTRNSMTWLHGLPGTGKSVIAYTLASRCRQKHRLAGSFFFSRRHMNCRSAHSAVLALAYQLGLSDPLAKEKIVAALNSDPGIIFPSRDLREQFVRLLIEPLEALDRTSRVFVMDAVDQCQDQGPDLISLLTRLLSHLTDMGLHIFFTSRDEVFIKRHFAPVTSVSIDHHFAVVTSDTADISPRHIDIDSDIRLFLQQSFKKIHTRHRLQCRKPWPPDEVLDHLVDGVGPYFDTASVIVKFVESPDHDPTDRMDLIRHVINPPLLPTSSVDEFYESIISTSHDIEQAYLHLTIVVSLVDMLSCSQLDSLLNRGTNQKFDMHCVLSQLPPLVRIPAGHVGGVQVCHESLCDFLYDPLRCGERFISQALVHRLLAYSCLSVMIEEFPDDCTISSRLSQLIAERSASLGDFDDESVLSLVAYSPPDPLQLLHTLWHIKRHRVVGLTADPRTNLALVYFCCTWQILQHLDLSTFGTLPAFRFLEDIRSLPVLLAFPLFLSFEFPVNAQTSGSSTLQDEPHIEVFDAVAEIVNHVYVIKEGCRTGSGVLDYACTHWVYHLSLAEWDEDLRSILTAFMTQKLQQWIVRAWCLQDLETCLWTLSEPINRAHSRRNDRRRR